MSRFRAITCKQCGSTGYVLWGSEQSKKHRETGLCPGCQKGESR